MNAKKINVPYISQKGRYPTGCESVSTVMLLQYLGLKLTVDDFISQCLKIRYFEERDGILYGPDPREFFCGDPYSEDGMGCYAPVIVKAVKKAFDLYAPACDKKGMQQKKYTVIDETGKPLDRLLTEYIDNDMPVIFWACINMRQPITGPEWMLMDRQEEKFTWISNEHCMLLVGYDDDGCWFNDPYDGNGVIHYPWNLVEERHAAQHSMAVAVACSPA